MGSIRGFTPYSERIGQYQNLNRREPNIKKPAKQILQSLVKWTADPSSMVPYGLAGSFFVALGLPSLFADFLPGKERATSLPKLKRQIHQLISDFVPTKVTLGGHLKKSAGF